MNQTSSFRSGIVAAVLIAATGVPSLSQTKPTTKSTVKISPLERLKESELEPLPKDSVARVYRLMIAPTWGNRFCIRIQNKGDAAILVVKRLAGHTGYEEGDLSFTNEISLSAKEFLEFELLVAKSGYEQMGLRDPDAGFDGDEWSLEVAKAGCHHAAIRWCPNAYDPKRRRTEDYVKVFRWAADKAGVTKKITNKGSEIFSR